MAYNFIEMTKKILFIFLLLVLANAKNFAGEAQPVDALIGKYKSAPEDTAKVKLAIIIAQEFMLLNPDSTIYFAKEGLSLAEKLNYTHGKATCLHLIGTAFSLKDDYAAALKNIFSALALQEQIRDLAGVAAGKVTMGNIYKNVLDFPKAMTTFIQARDMFLDQHDTAGYGVTLTCIANVYVEQDSLDKALDYFLRGLDISNRYKNRYAVANSYLNIAILYNKQKNTVKALQYAEAGLRLSNEIGYSEGDAGCRIVLAQIFMEKKNYAQAISSADNALRTARELESYLDISRAATILSDCYKRTGNYQKSLMYLEISTAANDSMVSIEKNESLSRIQYRHEVENQESQIILLQEREQAKNNILVLFVVAGLIGSIFTFAIFRSRQKERKVNELLLLQNEANRKLNADLQNLDEQKNKIMGKVAHDLRSPLSTICGLVEVIGSEVEEKHDEEVGKYLGYIDNITRSSLQLVNDLLDISVIASGNLALQKESVDYLSLVNETVEYYNIRSAKKNITIRLENQETIPNLLCDPNKTRQVLNNLLDNAIKYSELHTTISVRIKIKNEFVLTEVEDKGVGIPGDDIEKLFKEFSVTSVKSTGNEKSSGLGLAICKKIVETQGGQIGVRLSLIHI